MPKSRAKIWLGSYDTSEQAARAYDCAVYCLRGSNAKFNLPDSLPEIQSSSSLSSAQIQAVAAKFAREEFRQSADEYSLTSTCDSECSTGSSKNEEQEEWMLLFDSLLEDMDRNPNFDFEDLFVIEDFEDLSAIEDINFVPPEEKFISGGWKTL